MKAAQAAVAYRERLLHLPVGVTMTRDELMMRVNTVLPEAGEAPETALDTLIASVEKGLVNSSSPRYFGFVVGGSTPVSAAADWLTAVWNQNAQVYATSPSASIIEEVVARWILELLDLPKQAGVGFVTGTQMAHFTALAIARNAVLQQYGWDGVANGLQGAPYIQIICGECCHATLHTAIHMIGLGNNNVRVVPADGEGRMDLAAFQQTLADCAGPTIVCVQAGNVNTGAFDPIDRIIALSQKKGAWVHVDGAFGLWAGTSPRFKHLVAGIEKADSWATDAHKWLNVPYDSGMVIVRAADAFSDFKAGRCAYAGPADTSHRDGSQWTPENSRRARAFVLYAALRSLGRQGVQQIIENCCDMACFFASELSGIPGARILNQVILNQVLCRIELPGVADLDGFNAAVAARIQQEGVCWMGTTRWDGQTALRISVSNWATRREDVAQSVQSIIRAVDQLKPVENLPDGRSGG